MMGCRMRHFIRVVVVFGLAFWAETSLASISLELTNASPGTLLTVDNPANLDCDSIVKAGPGPYAIDVNLTNSGDTTIQAGLLAFLDGTTTLQNVFGANSSNSQNGQRLPGDQVFNPADDPGSSTLFVGGTEVLNATSIHVDTLAIGGDIKDFFTSVAVPEPASVIIWLLLGSVAFAARRW